MAGKVNKEVPSPELEQLPLHKRGIWHAIVDAALTDRQPTAPGEEPSVEVNLPIEGGQTKATAKRIQGVRGLDIYVFRKPLDGTKDTKVE